ncbi:glycoside hydrolase family 15 protein [Marinigracilibium pacificum]|uniref:Glycoside hydrolase family 15 protein n=1 Tax=Marinigracilibium pacificum TaxID=2729599 RepID=A0A848IXU2_9BACT|nr:glycoside hydrolase family 15 protein [Marinigracilibium pacificum]NMM48105.1 glycoside hydrolase family 15 protein [Marinigracilibium pacificum]
MENKKHIYPYAIIGNCAYLAYVNKNTNIDWMCWPKFDSSFIFGRMLDKNKGGEFSVLPDDDGDFKSKQYYIENTNVVRTEIETTDGTYRVTDYAPRFYQNDRYYKPLMMIRKVEPLSGTPRIKVKCNPVGNYGEIVPEAHRGSNHIEYLGLEQNLRLTTNISLTYIEDGRGFVLNEAKYMVLTYGAPLEASIERTSERFLNETILYWRGWVKSTSIGNFYQKVVIRSALALKIHQYEDTGAIIAAGTTSLPEAPGSTRNWDYRYCWMRDTFYTLNAFNNIGHFEEVEKYFQYIANVSVQENKRFQPLYSISGEKSLVEHILNLEGYMGNQPVRVGNQAYEHIQNDVYGQVLVSLLPLYIDNRFIIDERAGSHKLIIKMLDLIDKTLDEPDAGLWEFRTLAQEHCYTNLFQWAGASAALKIGKHLKDDQIINKAETLVKKAKDKIEQCWDKERGVYTQAIGSPNLDASTLQLLMMNYIPHGSDEAKSHLQNLEKELGADSGLFYRYKHADDFGTPETTFLITAFWYVEALTCVGRLDEAIKIFETLISFENHVGLLSEDVDAETGSQWGNFPQAYSHVGLINAANRISRKLDKPSFL